MTISKKTPLRTFDDYLEEHIVNLHTPEDKAKHVDHVWNMLQSSYAKLGGFHSAANKQELINDTSLWKLHRKDGKIGAVGIYKGTHGRKSIAVATDGTPEGKQGLIHIKAEDMKQKRSWGEVSGAIEHILLKHGGQYIPHDRAKDLTGKEILKYHDDGIHYDRMINGHRHTKAIVGFPKK